MHSTIHRLCLATAVCSSACTAAPSRSADIDIPPRSAAFEGGAFEGAPGFSTCEPRQISGITDAVSLQRLEDSACAVTRTGRLYCWGADHWAWERAAPILDSDEAVHVEPVEGVVQYLSLGRSSPSWTLHTDGSVRSWLRGGRPEIAFARRGIVEIDAQVDQTILARTNAGELLAWDHRGEGKLEVIVGVPPPIEAFLDFAYDPFPERGYRPPTTSPPYAVIAGPERRLHAFPPIGDGFRVLALTDLGHVEPDRVGSLASGCALFGDGSTRCWESSSPIAWELKPLAGLDHLKSLHEIMNVLCGLGIDGRLRCQPHECPAPSYADVEFVEGGPSGACLIRADGTVWCWGRMT